MSQRRNQLPTLFLAGGGSGGHISPGLAIAERYREVAPESEIIFICSSRPIDRTMLMEAGERMEPVSAIPPSLRRGITFIRTFRSSERRVRKLIAACDEAIMIALGGFVAVPAVRSARRAGVRTILFNLDNPPGKANRLIARWCDHVYSAVETPGYPGFAEKVLGLPVRRRAITSADRAASRQALGLDPAAPTVLVTGASQGATSMNRMMIELVKTHSRLFDNWQVLHLSGRDEEKALIDAYDRAGVAARVEPFLHEMGLAWGAADIAISRAGANSVAEVAVNGVPTIFLPYPYHADHHQRLNAMPLTSTGAALIMNDAVDPVHNAREMEPMLRELMRDPDKRGKMRNLLREMPLGGGAEAIVALALDAFKKR